MAGLPKGSSTFFRVSPAGSGKVRYFAVRRGDVNQVANVEVLLSEHYGALKALSICQYPLGAVGDMLSVVQDGLHGVRNYVADGVPLLGVGNVTEEGIDLSEVKRITFEEHERLAASQVAYGDLLVTITGRLGTAAIYNSSEPANLSAHVALCRGKPQHELRYLQHYLASRLGAASLTKATIGSTHPHINVNRLAELPIPLPSQTKQREISDKMDTARVGRKAKQAEADALLASIDDFLLEALGITLSAQDDRSVFAVRLGDVSGRLDASFHHPRYGQLADGLDAAPIATHLLGDFLVSISSGATPHRNDSSLYTDSGVKFLRILNIVDGEIVDVDMKYITNAVHSGELSRSRLSADDVLMTITGRVGSAAVVRDEHLPANINQHIVRMRIDVERCLPTFLCEWLNSAVGLELSNRSVSGGTRAALDYKAIRNIRVPLPPIAEQEHLVAAIVAKRNEARRLHAEAEADWQAAKRWFEEQLLGPTP